MSYVSAELIAKLRAQQEDLRSALLRLERRIDLPEQRPKLDAYRDLARLYRDHEALVAALLEAVEPDRLGR